MKRAPDELHSARGRAPLLLRRAWPRDEEHLLCEYAPADGEPVAAQWFARHERLRAVAAQTPGDIEIVAGAGVLLQRRGADRQLVALEELMAASEADLVVHRPERRAVVRQMAEGRTSYVKVVRPGRTGGLLRHATLVARRRSPGAFRTPTLRDRDDARGIVVWDQLAGRSLFALARASEAVDGWERAGRALALLHGSERPGVPTHSPGDEVALAQLWLAHAATFGVLPRVDATRALAPLLDGAPAPLGLLHRDLHDKQVLHQPGAPIGLLDLDTLAVGERALDLANLVAHIELRVRQGRLAAADARTASEALLQAYRPEPATRRRLDAYATATRLRLAAVYAFRPRWRTLARDLLREIAH